MPSIRKSKTNKSWKYHLCIAVVCILSSLFIFGYDNKEWSNNRAISSLPKLTITLTPTRITVIKYGQIPTLDMLNQYQTIQTISRSISKLPSSEYVIFYELLSKGCRLYAASTDGAVFKLTDCFLDQMVSQNFAYMYVNKEGLYDLRTSELVEKEKNNVTKVWVDSISYDGSFLGRKSKPLDSLWFREIMNIWQPINPEDPAHFTLEEPKLSPDKKYFSYVKSGIPHSNQTGLYISDFRVCQKNPEKCHSLEKGPLLDCKSRSMSWSPDSTSLVCASSLLETVSILDLKKRSLLPTPDDYSGAIWSPDGKWIAYSGRDSYENVNRSIYIIPAQGGTPVKLTGGINTTGVVAWLNKVTPAAIGQHYQILPMGNDQPMYRAANEENAVHTINLGDVITIEGGPIQNGHQTWWKIKDGEREGWIHLQDDWLKDISR